MLATNSETRASLATFKNSQGVELLGTLLRFTRHLVVLEVSAPGSVLRTSEVLDDFKLLWNGRTLYFGRAVVREPWSLRAW